MKKINLFLAFSAVVMLTNCTPASQTETQSSSSDSTTLGVPLNHVPDWSYDDVMYEVNIRQYSEEGTFRAFAEQIPRLKEMGVDILWLMPIHPIGEKNRKGSLGSYYSIKDYKAVNPEFGNLDDFKALVDLAHQHEMKVIIDWVANHSAWDANWVETNPEFYTKDSTGAIIPPNPDWTDVADLDYNNPDLHIAMIDAMKFWVETCDIDGFRCDVAGEVPMAFWDEAIKNLRAIKPLFMLAEWDDPKMHSSFNATYGWGYHHTLMEIGKGHYNLDSLSTYFLKDMERYPAEAFRLRFNTNHDENSWKGTEKELFGDLDYNFQVLAFTAPGMPLIYSGQESGLNKRLEFFEKDAIDWNNYQHAEFFKELSSLKHDHQVLHAGSAGGAMTIVEVNPETGMFVFDRFNNESKLRVVMNCSKSVQDAEKFIEKGQIIFPKGHQKPSIDAGRCIVIKIN
jgi:glycosidase